MLSKKDSQALIEANVRISKALEGIETNLKSLNDNNVLHANRVNEFQIENKIDHKTIVEKLQLLTEKYWWVIIVLIGALLITVGIKEGLKLFGV